MDMTDTLFIIIIIVALISVVSLIIGILALQKPYTKKVRLEHEISTSYKNVNGELKKGPTIFCIRAVNSGYGDIRIREIGLMVSLSGILTRIVMNDALTTEERDALQSENANAGKTGSVMPVVNLSIPGPGSQRETQILYHSKPILTSCDAAALYDFLYNNNARGKMWLYAEDMEGNIYKKKSLKVSDLKKIQVQYGTSEPGM